MADSWGTPPTAEEVAASSKPGGFDTPPTQEELGAAPPQDVFDLPRKAELTRWAFEVGSRVPPQRNADVLRLSAATGIPPQRVHDNFDVVKAEVDKAGVDYEQLVRDHPILAEFMSSPERAGMVRDDVANLGKLEWALSGKWSHEAQPVTEDQGGIVYRLETPPVWGAVLRDAFLKSELALRQSTKFLRTVASSGQPGMEPELVADSERVAELKAKVGGKVDYGSDSTLFKAFEFVADLVPMIAGTVASTAAGAAVAGPVGAVVAPLAFNFMLGVGPDYDQRRQVLKASGKEGDPDAEESALAWSAGVGWANAMLMSSGLGPVFAGVTRKLGLTAIEKGGAKAVEKILADETVGQVLKRAGIEYGKDYAQGLAAMQAMTLVSALSQEKFRADQMNDDFRWSEVGTTQAESFKDTLLPMAFLAGVSMPVRKYTSEVGRAIEIDRSAKRLQTAVDLARQTKAAEIAPGEVQGLVGQMAQGETIFLEKVEFDRLYQEKGVDPRAVAAKAMGDEGKAYDASAATGEIAVPAEVFLTQLARTADAPGLVDIARFSGADRNPRQAKLVLVETGKKLKKQADEAKAAGRQAPMDEIREDFAKKASAAGRSRLEAESNAEIVARSYAWFGAETGADPVELYRKDFPINVHFGPESAAPQEGSGVDPVKALAQTAARTDGAARSAVAPRGELPQSAAPRPDSIKTIQAETGAPVREDGTVNAGEVFHQTRNWREWLASFEKNGRVKAEYTPDELAKFRAGMESTAAIFGDFSLLPPEGSGSPLRPNSDKLFKRTFDITTICPRQDLYVGTILNVERELGHILNPYERHLVGVMLREQGLKPACFFCYGIAGRNAYDLAISKATNITREYVDLRRAGKTGKELDAAFYREGPKMETGYDWNAEGTFRKFLDANWEQLSGLDLNEVRLRDLARGYAEPRGDFERQVGAQFKKTAQAATLANAPKGWASMKEQILRTPDQTIQEWNKSAGLRMNSQTDFRPWHTLEVAEALAQLRVKEGYAHVYAKEEDLPRIFGATGIKINLSASYVNDASGKVKYGKEGLPEFDAVRGMAGELIDEFRAKYPRDVGGMLVALNDEHFLAGVKDPRVDMMIPYHAGSIPGRVDKFENTRDYSNWQLEDWKDIKAGEKLAVTLSNGKAVEVIGRDPITREHHFNDQALYLELCEKLGITPRFANIPSQASPGELLPVLIWEGKASTAKVADGYMKLVRDVAREPSDQHVVDPSLINWDEANRVISRWMELGGDGELDVKGDPAVTAHVLGRIKRGDWPAASVQPDGAPVQIGKSVYAKGTLHEGAVADIEGIPVRMEQMGKGDGERAFVRISSSVGGDTIKADIHLVSPDPSSLPHEVMHFLAKVMQTLSKREGAGQGIRDAWATVLKDMGYLSDASYEAATAERKALAAKEKPTPQERARLKELVAKEERFTHGFEQFLAEGRAPSAELLPVFARFKTWMARIYKGIDGVEKQYRDQYGAELALTEDVRNVFRRMLAGDQAVADAARESYQAMPLVALTPAEKAESDKLRAEAVAQAEAGVRRLIATEEQAADKAFIRAERARVEGEVRADIEQNSVYAAIDALSGASPGSPGPIDRAALVKEFGAAVADAMPKGTVVKDGLPPEVAADFVKFANVEDMVRAMVAAPPRDQFIKREVARRMREQFPRLVDRPALLADMAKVELANDPAIRDGIIRLRALAREAGIDTSRVPSAKELRDAADLFVEDVAYSDLRADRFDAAAKAAARRMAQSSDPKRRLDEFETYLFNHALVRSATEAKVEAEKAAAVALKYTTDKYRAKLGKAVERVPQADGSFAIEQPYLKAMDDLLASFEFRSSVSQKEIRGRDGAKAILEAFVEQRRAQGDDIIVPESTWKRLDRQTSWKDLTLYELRDLRTSVESIAKQAERQSTFDLGQEKLSTEKVITELVDGTLTGLKKTVDNPLGGEHLQTLREKLDKAVRQGIHSVERPELVLRALDHGKDDGPWHRYYWNKISDASYRYYDLARETSGTIQKMLRELPAADRKRLKETRFVEDGSEYTLENAIVVGANSGNESNWSKMIRGMSDPRLALYGKVPWQGEATARRILSHLTQKDVDLVNAIHKSAEYNWKATEALEKEMSGIAPPKVQAKPFKFKGEGGVDLVIDGGYYPLIYSDLFKVGKNQREADAIAANGLPGLFSPGYSRAMTPQGHVQARVERFARPLDLTLDALPRKLVMSAKDIAFRKDAIQLYRVLMDERVQGALTQAIGKDGADLIVSHLRDSVNDVMLPDSGAGWALRAINKIRGVTTESIFGLNVPQTLQNLADFTGVSAEVPTKYVMASSMRMAKDSKALLEQIRNESAEMRIRFDRRRDSVTSQMEDVFRRSELRVKWADAKEVMMAPFEATNQAVEVPVYLGAKQHWLELGKSEAEAIRHAEGVVRSLFGGKRTIDLPPVMRDKVLRHFTMFYGWANAQLNLFLKSTQTAGAEWSEGRRAAAVKALAKVYATLWVKNVASELLVGKTAEDYNEDGTIGADDVGRWIAYRGVMTLPLSAPFLGSMVRGMEGKQSRDVSFTPWLNVANAAVRAGKAVGNIGSDMSDEDAVNLFMAWMEVGGSAVGAPVAQARSTAKYWLGRGDSASFGEDALGTIYGPPKAGKLSDAIYGGGQ